MYLAEIVNNFFLREHKFENEFHEGKIKSQLYITLTMAVFFLLIALLQQTADMGNIILMANIAGIIGAFVCLYLIKIDKVEVAAEVLVWTCLIVICIADLLDDWLSEVPQQQYKIYVSLVALLGTYVLCISFFRSRSRIFFYSFMGGLILTAHSSIVYLHPLASEVVKASIYQHYIVALVGIVLSGVVFHFIIGSSEDLIKQNIRISNNIKIQNEYLELIVEERTKALKKSNENLKEFAHVVSHDLKEPLRTISGFLTLIDRKLKKMEQSDAQLTEYIGFATNGTRQMDFLIQDMLAYAKLNDVERDFRQINLNGIVKEVKEFLQMAVKEKEAILEIGALPVVLSTRSLMMQLFQNLISNGLKYCKPDVVPHVKVGVKYERGQQIFFIQDNGIGISDKYYDTIFQAFKRLHNKATYEGSGVGLAICKKIVELHNGRIWLESKEGEGTTFYFTLAA